MSFASSPHLRPYLDLFKEILLNMEFIFNVVNSKVGPLGILPCCITGKMLKKTSVLVNSALKNFTVKLFFSAFFNSVKLYNFY